jgi:hypothetical protein
VIKDRRLQRYRNPFELACTPCAVSIGSDPSLSEAVSFANEAASLKLLFPGAAGRRCDTPAVGRAGRTFTLPAGLAGSRGYAGTVPTAPADLGTSSRSHRPEQLAGIVRFCARPYS